MKRIFSLTCLLLFSLFSLGQNVTIRIINPNAKDGTEILYCRSIDGDPIHYALFYDSSVFENGISSKSFDIDSTMFIMVANNPYTPKIRLVIEKGDSINIVIRQDTVMHSMELSFKGKNHAGLYNYFKNSLFLGGKTNNEVYNTLTHSENLSRAIESLEELKDGLFKPMDSLFVLREISKEYYKFVKLEAESEFLAAVLNISGTAEHRYDADKDKFKLSKEDFVSLQRIFCEKYDPFSKRYRNVNYRSANAKKKCRLIEKGTIVSKSQVSNLKLWEQKDQAYNFAPVEIQEQMFSSDLISELKFGTINFSEATNRYERLKKAFPASVFVPVVKTILISNQDRNKVPPYSFVKYESAGKLFQYIEKDSLIILSDFVKRHFPGKAVLVDLWATWCSPCKEEFAFAKDLHSFLKDNEIEILYFSMDKKSNSPRWKKDIELYSLNGYHYLGTDAAADILGKNLNESIIGIPRYFLFNKEGNIVDTNLPRPSNSITLHKRILEKLQ
ncbi:TlpA disulfide reductase family protein [Dyadobacter sp. 3J3]|uniref:TlpA family protein disulfide reductase n=1 Tax=Dyadobacter sp. 3J3 TaxID=2606600 RepID=UPI001358A438|nr:TlpA disulfide reductase family protein [Dyadobacter sp. 3J3]